MLTIHLLTVNMSPMTKTVAFYYETKICFTILYIIMLRLISIPTIGLMEQKLLSPHLLLLLFLTDCVEDLCQQKLLPVIIYSDGCTHQNQNVTMVDAFLPFNIMYE